MLQTVSKSHVERVCNGPHGVTLSRHLDVGTGGPQRGGPPGPPGMMRAASGRPGGVQADVWSRGTQQAPLTPGGPLSGIQLHKTQNSFKVGRSVRSSDQ